MPRITTAHLVLVMVTRTFERTSLLQIPWLAVIFLVSAAGCFTSVSSDVSRRTCKTDQQCPVGYSCLAPNVVGGCCKPDAGICPAARDATTLDSSPIDLQATTDAATDIRNVDSGNAVDAPAGIDQVTGGAGGSVDANGSGGSDGNPAGGTGGTTPGTPDVPLDTPISPTDGPTIDAPGTCSADKDCPTQSPLCLGNKCAKCATDTDCAGRTDPACAASGLCVACTANTYCKGAAATCDTTTNQCVGCMKRSDCAGACQTCTGGVCTAIKSQDDPGFCAGTCDATGACKSIKGQACQALTDCAGGIPCADGYCCDKACTGSCEACDLATSLGTCTTLAANTQPHRNHPACIATDASCAGSCNGSTAACFYPDSACGTASCIGSSYQAAGTCGSGVCAKPAAQTCTNGETCQASTGKCGCDGTTCGGVCVNLATDAKNCASCGHDCLGGTCSGGQCQAAAVTSGSGDLYVIGVDSGATGNVYYQSTDSGTGLTNAFQVSKTAQNGTGAPLDLGGSSVEYLGVIGTKLFFDLEGDFAMCTFSSSAPAQCSSSSGTLPDPSGNLVPFKSPSPSYIAVYDLSSGLNPTISWYSTSGTQVQSFTIYASQGGPGSFFAFGDSVYWIQDATDSTPSNPDSAVYSVSASAANPTATRLTASVPPATYKIIDANALSLLFSGPSGLYRVALPNGDAAHAPQLLVSPASSSGSVTTATEDVHGVYWFENDGTMFTCSPTSCGGTKKALASGQDLVGTTNLVWPKALYQDSSALYWGDYTTGKVMRLVK
jgi:hypothetical protein